LNAANTLNLKTSIYQNTFGIGHIFTSIVCPRRCPGHMCLLDDAIPGQCAALDTPDNDPKACCRRSPAQRDRSWSTPGGEANGCGDAVKQRQPKWPA